MLGSGAKMLSCHVLKQFAVSSSRRPHYRNSRPSRETKKLHRSEGLFSYIPLGDLSDVPGFWTLDRTPTSTCRARKAELFDHLVGERE
jgi:hypothetical protein